MKIVTASLAALWLCLSFAAPAQSAEEFRGSWTLSKSQERGRVQFGVTLRNAVGGLSKHESDWPVSVFSVLDLSSSSKQEVTFVIEREVGRIECRGFIEGGEGAGAFTFKLSQEYLESMRSRDHDESDENEQFARLIYEVSVDYAPATKSENLLDFQLDRLLALRPSVNGALPALEVVLKGANV